MESKIRQVKESFEADFQTALETGGFPEIRIKYLGKRQGLIPSLLEEFRALPAQDKPKVGRSLNLLKSHVQESLRKGEVRIRGFRKTGGSAGSAREKPLVTRFRVGRFILDERCRQQQKK